MLHTWGQTLVHHPHLHCVIPGGGLANDGSDWVACRPGFFLPVRVLSRYFRRVLLAALLDAFESGELRLTGRLQPLSEPRRFAEHLRPARKTEWVVYAKRPFAGPEQVLDYLGCYTHRIAISNQRLRSLDDGAVSFRYTDYRSNGASRRKTMTLAAAEFIRRMLLHVLPPGFHRIRHYGFLANRARQRKLAECRRALRTPAPPAPQQDAPVTDYRDRYEALTGRSLRQCPRCHAGNMQPTDHPAGAWACPAIAGFVVTRASTSARRASAAPGVAGAVNLRLPSSRRAARPPSRPSPQAAAGRQPARTAPADPRQCRLPTMQRP